MEVVPSSALSPVRMWGSVGQRPSINIRFCSRGVQKAFLSPNRNKIEETREKGVLFTALGPRDEPQMRNLPVPVSIGTMRCAPLEMIIDIDYCVGRGVRVFTFFTVVFGEGGFSF